MFVFFVYFKVAWVQHLEGVKFSHHKQNNMPCITFETSDFFYEIEGCQNPRSPPNAWYTQKYMFAFPLRRTLKWLVNILYCEYAGFNPEKQPISKSISYLIFLRDPSWYAAKKLNDPRVWTSIYVRPRPSSPWKMKPDANPLKLLVLTIFPFDRRS